MKKTLTFLLASAFASTAMADTIALDSYLKSIDHAEVELSGRISFMRGIFVFYNSESGPLGDYFQAVIDAGRDMRELIESECEKMPCTISGEGTIEIRGAAIFLSIDTVHQLKQHQ